MKISLIDICKQIDDPRMNRKKVHKMETIIYIYRLRLLSVAPSPGMKSRSSVMPSLIFLKVEFLIWNLSPVMIPSIDSLALSNPIFLN